MIKVCIDPGHGGADPGAIAVTGKFEKESNLRVVLMLETLLTANGVQVLMTRKDDTELGLTERCNMANTWGADIFISLHADASGATAHGHHAIYSIHATPGQGGHKLASLLVNEVTKATGRQPLPRGNGGVWTKESESKPGKDYYAVIRQTDMPAVILERGFVTNVDDCKLLFDDASLKLQAIGIANAVMAYFGLEPIKKELFVDVPPNNFAKEAVEYFGSKGIVTGDGKGNFLPNNPMTRAEVVAFVYKALQSKGLLK